MTPIFNVRMTLRTTVYLLDTVVVSELRKRGNANQGVVDFFRTIRVENTPAYLSVITLGELRRGTDKIRYRGDVAQADQLEKWIHATILNHKSNLLAIDADIAQLWGRLRVPHHENAIDKLIAATALIHKLTVVTRNVADFERTGVALLNPFSD